MQPLKGDGAIVVEGHGLPEEMPLVSQASRTALQNGECPVTNHQHQQDFRQQRHQKTLQKAVGSVPETKSSGVMFKTEAAQAVTREKQWRWHMLRHARASYPC